MDQSAVDRDIQSYYSRAFDEDSRLTTRSSQGKLEFIRTHELITDRIAAGSRILDVGGATGIHAAALAAAGHEVVLIDPVRSQVDLAARYGTFTAQVGDARQLQFADDTFDVALVLGPLYHLISTEDRHQCLREAARVVVPGGQVFAAAIPRFIRHALENLGEEVPHPYPPERVSLLEFGTPTGVGRFPGGHFHTGEELADELRRGGLENVEVHAIEGAAGLPLEMITDDDPELLAAALTIVRRTGTIPGIRDISNHMMGIGTVR